MNLGDIFEVQQIIKKDVKRSLIKGNIQKAIQLIDCFADFTQRFNNILRDDDIEDCIKEISEKYIDSAVDIKEGDENTVVLYDQIGTTACLGVQYLRGLLACGYNVIYIYERYGNLSEISASLFKEIKTCGVEYHLINSASVFKNGSFVGNEIRDLIIRTNPSRIIAHPQAMGALGMSVLYSIRGAKKFRIVPGDHHFYLGYDCFDHFIEFRPFGWSTAVYERNINPSSIYNLSYYPIIDEFVDFQGFPKEVEGKVIIGAGGATYKFQGSDIFYELLEGILTKTDKAIFLFIGTPSSQLIELSKKDNIAGKILFLGYRKDFAAVIKNIDILFNSYPFSGGLFCQTAARFSKPIIAYSEPHFYQEVNIEALLGDSKEEFPVTITSKEEFLSQSLRLINDAEYRKTVGNVCKNILQTEQVFNQQLSRILAFNYPNLATKKIEYLDRTMRINRYINIRNHHEPDHLMILSKEYRLKAFSSFPCLIKDMLSHPWYVMKYVLSSYSLVRKIFK